MAFTEFGRMWQNLGKFGCLGRQVGVGAEAPETPAPLSPLGFEVGGFSPSQPSAPKPASQMVLQPIRSRMTHRMPHPLSDEVTDFDCACLQPVAVPRPKAGLADGTTAYTLLDDSSDVMTHDVSDEVTVADRSCLRIPRQRA